MLVSRGSRSGKAPPVAREGHYAERSLCLGCGAAYRRKTWRRRLIDIVALDLVHPATCPACRQVSRGFFHGEVRLEGIATEAQRVEALRRIRHVARRAAFTQPERRIVTVERAPGGLRVTTTSQKLAHRIACELSKAFHGRVRYTWSDGDGVLRATCDLGG